MKKFFAVFMTLCLLAGVFCVSAVPSFAGGFSATVCGLSADGLEWALGVYDDFEDAWNDAIYYATHLEEAWNSSVRFESEADRPAVEGFERVIIAFYDNWNAAPDGSFGSGIGFKDGAIYVPDNAKITADLSGYTIDCKKLDGTALYVDAGADMILRNGSVKGRVHADSKAKTSLRNVYVSGDTSLISQNTSSRFGSIFGDGSVSTIVSFIALAAAAAAIGIVLTRSKKKQDPAKAEHEES